jgi:hypothetical protein
MNLKERLSELQMENKQQSETWASERSEKEALEVKGKAEEQITLDNWALIAKEKLQPYLEVVNEMELRNQGEISIDKEPRTKLRDSVKDAYVAANLKINLGSQYSDEARGFRLQLRLKNGDEVMVFGGSERNLVAQIRFEDENFGKKIEDAILALIQGGGCYWSYSMRDRSVD